MHFGFDAASALVSAPVSPQGAAQVSLRIDRIVTSNCSGARWFLELCILAWRDHCMGVSGGNRLVTFTGVVRPIRSNATDVLIGWNLVQKFG